MYYLFAGYDRYMIQGGADDFIGIFPTLADATTFACDPQPFISYVGEPTTIEYDWWHVAELRDGKLVVVARSLDG